MKRTVSSKSKFLRISVLLVWSCALLGIFVSESLPNGLCCWAPHPPNKSFKEDFEGKVTGVSEAQKQITINYRDEDVTFKFDEKQGSKEQERLLQTIKEGDILRGKAMENKGMYYFHLDKKAP